MRNPRTQTGKGAKEIERVQLQVDRAQEQGADWDDEEGSPVLPVTANRAKDLLTDIASRAEADGKDWASPAVSATPEGGIHFSWSIAQSRVGITVCASYENTVCVSKFRGGVSRRELLSDSGAAERVLQAIPAVLEQMIQARMGEIQVEDAAKEAEG